MTVDGICPFCGTDLTRRDGTIACYDCGQWCEAEAVHDLRAALGRLYGDLRRAWQEWTETGIQAVEGALAWLKR